MRLTDEALLEKAEAQERSVQRWNREAMKRIGPKMADAMAHGQKALTDTLRETRDGRPSLRVIERSPSTQAAIHRLGELLDELAGPSRASLDGLIRKSREVFLIEAMDFWAGILPAEILRDGREPTSAERRAIRRVVLHGTELRDEIAGPIDRAAKGLIAALHQAGSRGEGDSQAGRILSTWSESMAAAIARTCKLAISDGAVRADVCAGWLVVRPEFRDPEFAPPIELEG
jgi:hypothetical protein